MQPYAKKKKTAKNVFFSRVHATLHLLRRMVHPLFRLRESRAAAPKRRKSCRTQGDFCSSIRPSVRPSLHSPQALLGLKSALSELKSALSGLESVRAELERTNFRPERADFRKERADPRPERADVRLERADFRSERVDFRPERADFRLERAWGGLTNGWMNGRMEEQKSPCVLYAGLRPL